MQTDIWYDLELRGLAGGSTAEELIREAEAAQFSADDSDADESEGEEPESDRPGA